MTVQVFWIKWVRTNVLMLFLVSIVIAISGCGWSGT